MDLQLGHLALMEHCDDHYQNGEHVITGVSPRCIYGVPVDNGARDAAYIRCMPIADWEVVQIREDDELVLETVVALQRLSQTPAAKRRGDEPEVYERASYVAGVLLDVLDRKEDESGEYDDDKPPQGGVHVFESPDEFFGYVDKLISRLEVNLHESLKRLGCSI